MPVTCFNYMSNIVFKVLITAINNKGVAGY